MQHLASSMMLVLAYLIMQTTAIETSTYTTKYDGIDLDEILANDRMLTGYVNCLMDNGPCTPDGKELKKNLPEAIENDCKKCTKRQQEGADQVMHYIIDHRPDDWTKLEEKYNEDGSYKRKYLARRKEAEEAKKEEKEKSKEASANSEDDKNSEENS